MTAVEDEIREKTDHANGRLGALFAQLRDALAERGRRLSEAAERLRKSMADKAFAKKPLPDKLAYQHPNSPGRPTPKVWNRPIVMIP